MTWNEPALEELLTIKGGYAAKSFPVKSHKEFVVGHGEVTFVHISKKEEWLLNCACGKLCERSLLKRSQFFTMIQSKARLCAGEEREGKAAVAAGAGTPAYDPMEALDNVASDRTTPKKEENIYTNPSGTRITRG